MNKQRVCLTKLVQPVDLIDQKYITEDSKITEELIKKLIKLKLVSEFKNVLEGASRGLTAYLKPEDGIPMSDLSKNLLELISRIDLLALDSNDFGLVTYDSATKRINFYSANDTNLENVLGSLDVTKFLTMLSGGVGITIDDILPLLNLRVSKSEVNAIEDGDYTYIKLKNGLTTKVINKHLSLEGKLDKLVSGQNIKTINDLSILGDGNIDTPKPDWSVNSGSDSRYIENRPVAIDSKLFYSILPPIILDGINEMPVTTATVPTLLVGKIYHTTNNKITRYIKLDGINRTVAEDPLEGLVYFNKQNGTFYRYGQENPGEDKKMIEISIAGEPGDGIYAIYDQDNERLIFLILSGIQVNQECLIFS